MWPAVGPPLLLVSWQSLFGSTFVKSPGNSATTHTRRMKNPEIQKIGRRRASRQASIQRLLGLSATLTTSMASRGVSSRGATKWFADGGVASATGRSVRSFDIADPWVEQT